MRARLSDARFFYDEDCKIPLAQRREKLAGIVFQNKLGHMLAKSDRVERLVGELGQALSLSEGVRQAASKGAHLAKCDLVSLMVGEFPDLQGIMGREYALVQGEPAEVADVIRDHYAPRGAKDKTAPPTQPPWSRFPTGSIPWWGASRSGSRRPGQPIPSRCDARPSRCCAR